MPSAAPESPITCGPADAVTCLNRLNIEAEESTIALAARASIAYGIDPRLLAAVLNTQHSEIHAEHVWVGTIEQLRTPAVADCVMPRVGGHYVAVLEITAEDVIVGDPLSGLHRMPRAKFMKVWKRSAITIQRKELRDQSR